MVLGDSLRSVLRDAGVVLVFFLLAGSVVWSLAALTGYGVAAAIIATLAVVGLLVFGLRRTDADGGGSVWNEIPSWQYDGRHAESGGLTRGEQEQALEAINDEATQRTDDHRRRN